MKLRNVLISMMMLFLFCSVTAKPKFTIFGGLNLPAGDFADDSYEDNDSGYGMMGFGAGASVYIPLSNPNLNAVFRVMYLQNNYNVDELKEDIAELYADSDTLSLDANRSSYRAVPIMGGLSYIGSLSENLSLYLEGMIGISYISYGESDLSYFTSTLDIWTGSSLEQYSETVKYDPNIAFTYSLGGGLLFKDRFKIGLQYINLGKNEINYTSTYNSNFVGDFWGEYSTGAVDEKGDIDQSISMFLITLGFQIN